ncbi:hypothetical protein F5Y17DRAFT_36333 [Xylariaceae sp. FL0594]|nr:hypothetical protein F5Y17DRAFT_36333 [Xylariaceae sp. FL0594]
MMRWAVAASASRRCLTSMESLASSVETRSIYETLSRHWSRHGFDAWLREEQTKVAVAARSTTMGRCEGEVCTEQRSHYLKYLPPTQVVV